MRKSTSIFCTRCFFCWRGASRTPYAARVGRGSGPVRMGRPTNGDENPRKHFGGRALAGAGLKPRLQQHRQRGWVFDCARVLQNPLLAYSPGPTTSMMFAVLPLMAIVPVVVPSTVA